MRLALFLAAALPAAAQTDLLGQYGQLRGASLDAGRVAVAENVVLKKDVATFEFKNGSFYALEPVGGRVAGMVFMGNGVFTLEPPSPVEQRHLAQFTDKQPRVEEPFREAVLLFSDSTFTDLSAGAAFKPGTVDPKAVGLLGDSRKTFRETLKFNVEARLLAGLASPRQSLFVADIRGQKHGRFLFSMDPMQAESVSLIHYNGSSVFDRWSSFNGAGTPSAEQRALVHTSRISLDIEVDKRGKLAGESVSEFQAIEDGGRMLQVQLAPSLRVSKVLEDGGELKYIQEAKDKDGELWVALPKPLVKGENHSWRIAYAGDGVVQKEGDGNFFVGERESWYPKIDVPGGTFNDRAAYHLKFRNPKELTLVATGKLLSRTQEAKTSVSEWETEVPVTVAGFNYGSYKSKTLKDNDQEITVYANAQLGDELKELEVLLERNPDLARANGITPGGFNTTGLADRTLAESANALRVFNTYFGRLPFKTISLTQQPAGNFGQSWPTLIFMPYTAFLDDTIRHQLRMDRGRSGQFFDEVGSHEISHQWWGHLVSWKDYHDQWLSEGFAQFSAGLYLHRAQGEKKFKTFLEADRQFILSPLPGATIRANDAGPIWMGFRLSTEKNQAAYRLVYAKGAFVLHMLRMMMYYASGGDDSQFIAMMKDFVQSYAGRSASTADFKAICDKYFATDMGWFFDQWVYGTAIPKITIEYHIADAPDGVVLTIDAQQQNVPENFRSVLPFVLRAKGGMISANLSISKPTLHSELKLKEKPDTVEFNPLYGLLCELEVKKR